MVNVEITKSSNYHKKLALSHLKTYNVSTQAKRFCKTYLLHAFLCL